MEKGNFFSRVLHFIWGSDNLYTLSVTAISLLGILLIALISPTYRSEFLYELRQFFSIIITIVILFAFFLAISYRVLRAAGFTKKYLLFLVVPYGLTFLGIFQM